MRRKLAAILAADVVGYSARMGADEAGTLAALKTHREQIFAPAVARHGGRIFKLMGDGALAEFPSAIDAVECALAVQAADEDEALKLRIAVHLGDVIHDGDDIYGDGVNVAARLEALASPGGVCLSDVAQKTVAATVNAVFEDAGEHELKNIDRPVRIWRWPATGAAPMAARGRPLVAVAPFAVMSRDQDDAFLAEGIADDLATALAKIDAIGVLPRAVAAKLVAGGAPALTEAAKLGATALVEGGLRSASGRLRVNIRVADCASGEDLWAERFDGVADAAFDLQDEAVEAAVSALEVLLADGQQARKWRAEAGDTRAYDLFLAGRTAWKEYTRAGISRSREYYEAALALSPDFSSAQICLARTHVEDARFGWSGDKAQSLLKAHAILDEVLSAFPDHGLALAELGHAHMTAGAFAEGRAVAERAIAADPNLADALHVCATLCVCQGDHLTALGLLERGRALNPANPDFYEICRAEALVGLGRLEEAQPLLSGIVERRPRWLTARALLVIAEQGLGRGDAAAAEAARLLAMNPRFSATRWRRIISYPDRPDIARLSSLLIAAGIPE